MALSLLRCTNKKRAEGDRGVCFVQSLGDFTIPRAALAQRQAVLGVLLDGSMKGGMADHYEARARHDFLDVQVLSVPALDLVIGGLAYLHAATAPR